MKIDVRQIMPEGVVYFEAFEPKALDLETEIVAFDGPVNVRARVSRITNAVSVHLDVDARMRLTCSRCLEFYETFLKRSLDLNYPAEESKVILDLDPDIREEIILDYPFKPLCKRDCRGLCPKCGKNLNEGKCNC
jgi:uncharacterized protein